MTNHVHKYIHKYIHNNLDTRATLRLHHTPLLIPASIGIILSATAGQGGGLYPNIIR